MNTIIFVLKDLLKNNDFNENLMTSLPSQNPPLITTPTILQDMVTFGVAGKGIFIEAENRKQKWRESEILNTIGNGIWTKFEIYFREKKRKWLFDKGLKGLRLGRKWLIIFLTFLFLWFKIDY